MLASEGITEIAEKHCSDEVMCEAIVEVLEDGDVNRVTLLANLKESDVNSLRESVLKKDDALKDKKIAVGATLRTMIREASFQVDLAESASKVAQSTNRHEQALATFKRRVESLKGAFGLDLLDNDVFPTLEIFNKLRTSLGSFISFKKELMNCKYAAVQKNVSVNLTTSTGATTTASIPLKEAELDDPGDSKLSGCGWLCCYNRYVIGLLLADREDTPGESEALTFSHIDPLTLLTYQAKIAQIAADAGWALATQVDDRFRKTVETKFMNGCPLRQCFQDAATLAGVRLELSMKPAENRNPKRNGRGSSSSDDSYNHKQQKRSRGICFQFRDYGSCDRQDCPYVHRKAPNSKTGGGKKDKPSGKLNSDSKYAQESGGITRPGDILAHVRGISEAAISQATAADDHALDSLVDGSERTTALVDVFLKEVENLSTPEVERSVREWVGLDREAQSASGLWDELYPLIQECGDRIRSSWGSMLGVETRPAAAGGPIRALLMREVLRELQEEYPGRVLDWGIFDLVDQGVPLGTTSTVPRSGSWPRFSPHNRPKYPLSRELWCNYKSAEEYEREVLSTVMSEIDSGRMAVIDDSDNYKVKAITRLACIPYFRSDGSIRKVRLVDDMRRSGANGIIEKNLEETILLPTIRSAVATLIRCCDKAEVGTDDSDDNLYWIESDVRGAFRLLALAPEDTWFCVNKVGNLMVRHLVLPFGATSSPLLFVRVSSGVSLLECRIRRQAKLDPRVIIYVDDRGSAARWRRIVQALLISVVTDAVCGVPTAFDKFHASREPHCHGFVMDLQREGLTISQEKCSLMVAPLATLDRAGKAVCVKTLRRLTGRLTWLGGVFRKINPFIRPFHSICKVAEAKELRSIRIGRELVEAARFLKHFLERDCTISFNSLLPELGPAYRAVVISDASRNYLGGVVAQTGNQNQPHLLWYHLDLMDDTVSSEIMKILAADTEAIEGICFYELLSAALGALLSEPGTPVVVVSDNRACVEVLRKMRGKSAALNSILQRMMVIRPELAGAATLHAYHLSGERNLLADQISRSDISHNRSIFAAMSGAAERDVSGLLAALARALPSQQWLSCGRRAWRLVTLFAGLNLSCFSLSTGEAETLESLQACQRELLAGRPRVVATRQRVPPPSAPRGDRPRHERIRKAPSVARRGCAKRASRVSKRLTEADICSFLSEARAPSTRRSYDAIRRAYSGVMDSASLPPYPYTPAKAVRFIASLMRADFTYESVRNYAQRIKALAREDHGDTFDTQGEERFKLALRAASKLCRQSGTTEQSRAGTFTAVELASISKVQDPRPEGTVCAILCGTSCLLRVGELLSLTKKDVLFSEDGREASVTVRKSKTDPGGRGCTLTIGCCCTVDSAQDECPVHRLRWWASMCDDASSQLFPYSRDVFVAAMHDVTVKALGHENIASRVFKGHSLRRSGAQILFHHGVNLEHIVEMGRWASTRSLSMAYCI
ncbi:hypothetical protein FOL46_008635 [Perkinsus olseni]|uniref:C3H1-type domain-containing protein n=1 Tax=Perkinsus olseni TaxID=32597 RepID=A0A7J6MMV3_PEROL|nr:hypothetical protein FOL46_008635 [Perkinsus olseni]